MYNLLGTQFVGPYYDENEVEQKSGVYLIASPLGNIIDIGESGNLQNRLKTHDRKDQWRQRLGEDTWIYYVSYMPENERMEVEKKLRSVYPNLCGER